MAWLITLITPRRWWASPLGVLFWGVVASVLAYLVEFAVDGGADDPFFKHFFTTSLIAAPLIVMGMCMFRHLDRLQRDLAIIAATDPLTGLTNRRAFLARADAAKPGVLLMLDLDHFKAVNDTYGHTVGDAVLMRMAELMRRAVRDSDIVGRLGGEEFAVFLIGATQEEAARIGNRLARGVVCHQNDVEFVVTASIGAVEVAQDGNVLTLLRDADQALYTAKRQGRARYQPFQAVPTHSAMMSSG